MQSEGDFFMPHAPGSEVVIYKPLGALGVTLFAAIPPVMAAIEPATWRDIEARMVYLLISTMSAGVVLIFYRPKDRMEIVGRMLGAAVFCFAFVEPIAVKVRPYVMQSATPDSAPLSAAFPAAVLCGICGWWAIGAAAWFAKNPAKIFKLIDVIRGKTTAQSIFEETDSTSTKGGSQGQPGIEVTRTPEQTPTKVETPVVSESPTTNTT